MHGKIAFLFKSVVLIILLVFFMIHNKYVIGKFYLFPSFSDLRE